MKKCLKCGMLNEDEANRCKECSNIFDEDSPTWDEVMKSEGVSDYLFDNDDIEKMNIEKIRDVSMSFPPRI